MTDVKKRDLPRPFGRYTLQSLLGEGGMAQVYRAELSGPSGFRKPVAIKLMKAGSSLSDPSDTIREARIGGLLKHPHVIDVYELGELDGQLFIAMELVEGLTLAQLIQNAAAFPPSVVFQIATAITAGLDKAHQLAAEGRPAGLVHCDLKPSNVLLSWDGAIKIADFGVAVLGDAAASGAARRGTLSYMSPEQIRGEPLDGRSDLFSLGLVIAAMLLRRNPLEDRLLHQLLASGERLQGSLMPPEHAEWIDAIVPGLAAVLDRCLDAEASARFPDASALSAALRALQERVPGAPRLVDWIAPLRQQPRPAKATSYTPTAPAADAPLAGNLGPACGPLVGRAEAMGRLRAWFDRGPGLLTLTGTAGVGKTRTARHFARKIASRCAGGAWFVDLTEARSLVGLLHATADALEEPLSGGGDLDALTERLGQALRKRGPTLLVLDNFEQIVEHAEVVERWCELAPEAWVLMTSRELLGLSEEQIFSLGPLSESAGVALFLARARTVGANAKTLESSREAIAGVVRAIDGLPLAIELAAARTRLIPPAAILERLAPENEAGESSRFRLLGGRRGASGKQSSLLRALDWSWGLLEPWEQSAMAQLSVFRGGFLMEAAEAVLDLSPWQDRSGAPAPWAMDIVDDLLDKSLLYTRERDGQPRFGMYLSLREYAERQLQHDDPPLTGPAVRDATRARHAAHFARMGDAGVLDSLQTHGGVAKWRSLRGEIENLCAASESGDADCVDPGALTNDVACCALAAGSVFYRTGPLEAGIALLRSALVDELTGALRARLLFLCGGMTWRVGRPPEAKRDLETALQIAEDLSPEDPRLRGRALAHLAAFYMKTGQIQPAVDRYTQALALHQGAGSDRLFEGLTLGNLANLHVMMGQNDVAMERFQACLTIMREVGNRTVEGTALFALGHLYKLLGRLDLARPYYEQSLALHRETNNRTLEAITLDSIAMALESAGQLERAQALSEAALEIIRELGNAQYEGAILKHLGVISTAAGDYEAAQMHLERALQIFRANGNRMSEGNVLGNLAVLYLESGDHERAQAHSERSLAAHREVGYRSGEVYALAHHGRIALARGEPDDAEAWFREAIALAESVEPKLSGPLRHHLARLCADRGDLSQARALLDAAAEQAERTGAVVRVTMHRDRAHVERVAGDLAAAEAALAEAERLLATTDLGPASSLWRSLAAERSALNAAG